MENYYAISKTSITLSIDGELKIIPKDHCCYSAIEKELKSKNTDWKKIKEYMNTKQTISNFIGSNLKIENGKFTYQTHYRKWNRRIELKPDNPVVHKILEGFSEGRNYMPFVKFLDNLTRIPNEEVLNDLYKFLEANELPITDDGCFLAYKRVNSNFTDCHTGTIDNSVGQIVTMPRNKVEFDRLKTCSAGLHFCSKSYLGDFGSKSQPIVVVKINPMDVVSIPVDYNQAKGRCCRYEVIDVLKNEDDPLKTRVSKSNKSKKLKEEKLKQKNPYSKKTSKKAKIDKKLPVFANVEDMRKNFKPRIVNNTCYIDKGNGIYKKYQFIGGTKNENLKCIEVIEN